MHGQTLKQELVVCGIVNFLFSNLRNHTNSCVREYVSESLNEVVTGRWPFAQPRVTLQSQF